VTISAPATMAGRRQATKEDTISGAVEESLLEDDLDPEPELEAELDPDADGEFDAVADLDADVALDADVDADDSSVDVEVTVTVEHIEFELGDNVVYPHHGAGQVQAKEIKEVFGVRREYLTIKILHNDMTVMVPTENAALAGLRRVIDEETVEKVLNVLRDDVSDMPKNWNRRFKHNRDKIKTGDIYELAEVVRNLALRESEKGLSSGEKQMYTRAKKILASELMYALDKDEDEAEAYLDGLLSRSPDGDAVARGR
jgi:CarD family transcriptional regulator